MARSKTRLPALAFAVLAAVAGALSIGAVHQLFSAYEEALDEARRPERTVLVMVAARDLYQGIAIDEADLYAVAIPPRYLPDDVFLDPDLLVGRTPRERILANELVRSERLADAESGQGMHALIPRGLRAISINLSDGQALSGFLEPGDYVDLLVTMTPDGGGSAVTRTVLQGIFVVGVNNRMTGETQEGADAHRERSPPSVTLLVTADQAEDVAFSEALGRITLSLRPSDDLDPNTELGAGVTIADFLRRIQTKKPARRAAVDPTCTSFRLIKGRMGRTYKVDCDGRILE